MALLLPPHLPCVLHCPHPLCILLLLFVHILLFSLSSYFVCRKMHKSCCWSLYCDVYKSQLSVLAIHLQVRVLKSVSSALWAGSIIICISLDVLLFHATDRRQHQPTHCDTVTQECKKVSYKLLEENAKIFVTVLIADPEHSQVYITSGWSVYQTIKSAVS